MFKYCKCFYSSMSEAVSNLIAQQSANRKVHIQGWIKSVRKLKEYIFLDVNDGSSGKSLQVLIDNSKINQKFRPGSSVSIKGILNTSPNNQLELCAEDVEICGDCIVTDGYPFAPRKYYSPEYVRQYLHFRPRTNKFSSLLRIRSNVVTEVNKFFSENGFTQIHTPILTSNDCEGAGEIFTVCPENKEMLKTMLKSGKTMNEAYFDSHVYLTVSGQLHLEAAAHGLSKVYTLGPVFRAENSRSRLHLSEFYMLEAEMAFIYQIEDILAFVEKLIRNLTSKILETCKDDIERISKDNDFSWLNKPFAVLTYDEAVEILQKNNSKFISGSDFAKEDELSLTTHCGNVPTFVINWPKSVKPFYMRECENNSEKVNALDLLVPGVGEIVGGGLRENNYEKLKERLPNTGANFGWYLELRKFGSVPTGGFGLGFERYLQFILKIDNIKDTIPFPRWPHNCQL